jgi:hypothetical protein
MPRRRELHWEQLESRVLLAGDISVHVSRNNLYVGDQAANQVAILQLDAGTYAVVGLGSTTVEGQAEPFVASGITGKIDVDLKGGNDLVGFGNDPASLIALAQIFGFGSELGDAQQLEAELEDLLAQAAAPARLFVPRNLELRTGDGRDGAAVLGDIEGKLHADLGAGDNALAVVNSFIGGDLIARGGKGHDDLFVDVTAVAQKLDANLGDGENIVEFWDSFAGKSAVVVTGKHADTIDFADSVIEQNLTVRTSAGDDEVLAHAHEGDGIGVGGNVDIVTGSQGDYVKLEGLVLGNVTVNTGEHGDGVLLDLLAVEKNLKVNLGSGNDGLAASGVLVLGNAALDAGAGTDEISLLVFAVDQLLTAQMGTGDDELEIFESTAAKAVLRGGSGTDKLNSDNPDFAPNLDVKQFEDSNLIEEEEVPEDIDVAPSSSITLTVVVIHMGTSSSLSLQPSS